jgi:DNA polymerase
MRAALIAPPDHVVVAGDSSQIEARLTATISGADTLVQQFESGEDVYASFATLVFGFPVNKDEHPTERFVGKQAVLGLGFGLGWLNFVRRIQIDSKNQTGAMIQLSEQEGRHVVNLYRSTYKEIPDAWDMLGTLGIQCLVNGGPWRFGPVVFDRSRILLPSGLSLYYHDLQWDGAEWTYDTGYEGRKKIYGPKLMENIIQALARIITMEAGVRIRRLLGPFALQSHDELVYIVRKDRAEEARSIINNELRVRPDWMPAVPLSAAVKIGPNYAAAK